MSKRRKRRSVAENEAQIAPSNGNVRVLLPATGPPDELFMALATIHERLAPSSEVTFLVTNRQLLIRRTLESMSARHVVSPVPFLGLLRTIRELRREEFDFTVVPLTGQKWHKRLKVAGLLLGSHSGWLLNENGDYCRLSWIALWRHVRWRFLQAVSGHGRLFVSALRLLQRSGWRAFFERAKLRWQASGRRLTVPRRLSGILAWRRSRVRLDDISDPAVSIIIPAHNQWSFTLRCLHSIARCSEGVPYEVVLVDNASTDRTPRFQERVENLVVVRLASNEGFVGACNAGARLAKAPNLLFLNNDVEVTKGWLLPLLDAFDKYPSCGAVGAKLVYPNGRLQEAGGIVWQDGSAWNYGRSDDPSRPGYCYVREIDYCSGAALMVRREVFSEVGGFDEAYSPGYWEDTDLCFAVRKAGKTVLFQPASVVRHYEGATSGRSESHGMKRFQVVNAATFRQKWERELASQCPLDPRLRFVARDRNRNPTVLVFDHYVPTPDRDAGSSFMYWLLYSLRDRGYRVIFWPDNLFCTPVYASRLQQIGVEVLYGPLSIVDYLAAYGKYIDYAIAYRAQIALKYLPHTRDLVKAQAYIAVDLEHVREHRRLRTEGSDHSQIEAALWKRESKIVRLSDCVGAHSPVEREILRSELGARDVVELPLPVPRSELGPASFEERANLLFVGSTHPPNVDGIRHFIFRVLPRIQERLPGIELWIAGDVCRHLRNVEAVKGIRLLGYVESLQELLNGARVFVAPLRYGAGIKGKILNAMNAGIPVVTTPVGAEGIGLEDGTSALIAEGDAEFADRVVEVYSKPVLWDRVRRMARQRIEESLSIDHFERSVDELMRHLRHPPSDRDHEPKVVDLPRMKRAVR